MPAYAFHPAKGGGCSTYGVNLIYAICTLYFCMYISARMIVNEYCYPLLHSIDSIIFCTCATK